MRRIKYITQTVVPISISCKGVRKASFISFLFLVFLYSCANKEQVNYKNSLDGKSWIEKYHLSKICFSSGVYKVDDYAACYLRLSENLVTVFPLPENRKYPEFPYGGILYLFQSFNNDSLIMKDVTILSDYGYSYNETCYRKELLYDPDIELQSVKIVLHSSHERVIIEKGCIYAEINISHNHNEDSLVKYEYLNNDSLFIYIQDMIRCMDIENMDEQIHVEFTTSHYCDIEVKYNDKTRCFTGTNPGPIFGEILYKVKSVMTN